jgi:hypothetical protein
LAGVPLDVHEDVSHNLRMKICLEDLILPPAHESIFDIDGAAGDDGKQQFRVDDDDDGDLDNDDEDINEGIEMCLATLLNIAG